MFDKIKGKENPKAEKPILLYDEKGNQYAYSKEDWAKNILPNELKKVWALPDQLYNIILMCLRDEIYNVLIEPALQLLKIDYDLSRVYSIAGIVYLKNDKLKEAECILKEGISKLPNNGVLYTNLAKVYSIKGKHKLSYDTLWKGLMLDPNQDNALNWIGAIYYEKGGEKERNKIFDQLTMLPNSWRPQLFIARYYLENELLDEAKKLYLDVLSKAANEADVIMMITGDLGINGKVNEIFEIAYPFFDLNKHGIKVGLNFIQACIQGKRKDIGIEILSDIKKLERLDYIEQINKLEKQLYDM